MAPTMTRRESHLGVEGVIISKSAATGFGQPCTPFYQKKSPRYGFVLTSHPFWIKKGGRIRWWTNSSTMGVSQMIEMNKRITAEQSGRFDSVEDFELERRIFNYLYQRLPNLESIEVETHHGTAVLRGVVPSPSVKWRCVDCCSHVAGVLNVIDRLRTPADSDTETQPQNRADCDDGPQSKRSTDRSGSARCYPPASRLGKMAASDHPLK